MHDPSLSQSRPFFGCFCGTYIQHIPPETVGAMRSGERFAATGDFGRLSECDVVVICVPTPLTPQREPDLSYVTNRRPPIDEDLHDEALARGLIRYCPICDGYEVTDKRVGIIGDDSHGVAEAMFLRSYTPDVTLVAPHAEHRKLDAQDWSRLEGCGIAAVDGPVIDIRIDNDELVLVTSAGEHRFDSVYPALGSDIHSSLAEMLGVQLAEDGCVKADDHQRTSVPGVYAAGDVVKGLDQISHAMGEGGVAATTIRNDLAKISPLLR